MGAVSEFLQAIPAAASSPYALIAYVVALIVAAYAGFRLRELQSVLRTIQARPSTSDSQMVEVIKVVTQRPVPPQMTGAQWIRYQRLQAGLLIVIALIIAFLTIAVMAISPDKHRPVNISGLTMSLQSGTYKVSALVSILSKLSEDFTLVIDDSVPEETRKRLVKLETFNNVPLETFLKIFCDRAGKLKYYINPSTNMIILYKEVKQ
ncbi:hypothetical protein [Candidatus Electronema sp. TJ]|uniref:hypothetical protein n=1 Tax=Candidatus Electronema sp. TJ TaxID=3401573 RepID=UPI003AA9160B